MITETAVNCSGIDLSVFIIPPYRYLSELQQRQETVDSALGQRGQLEDQLLEVTRLLCVVQEDLKQASRGVGPRLEEATDRLGKAQVQGLGAVTKNKNLCF